MMNKAGTVYWLHTIRFFLSVFTVLSCAIISSADAEVVFRIFYSDTNRYNPAVRLEGCSGDRYPVVVRAVDSSSGEILTDKDNDFSITTSPAIALSVFADEESADPVTTGTLVNGEARLWIQCTQSDVVNGTISVFVQDGNVFPVERDSIFFNPCNNSITNATYYADNGVGSVDRLEVYFRDSLSAEEIPDTFELYWPVMSDETERIVTKEYVTLDPADPTHLTVTIDPPFPAGITGPVKSTLGKWIWHNPRLYRTAPPSGETFIIHDGAGPLIKSAILVERLNDGNDTLQVTFTETVSKDVVRGVALYLIKKGADYPIEMNVIDAIPGDGSAIRVITNVTPRPEAGDSLRIIPTGTVTDKQGNHAPAENRPVAILLQPVPADIADAVYLDRNADGNIDVVKITFKKTIDPNQTAIRLKWEGQKQNRADFTGSDLEIVGDGNSIVEIAVDSTTFKKPKMVRTTGGKMEVEAVFFAFTEDNKRECRVRDGAAPVIKEIEYHKGRSVGVDPKEPDTLFVMYTEYLETGLPNPPDKKPVFYERNDVPIPITYTATGPLVEMRGKTYYRFLVDDNVILRDEFDNPVTPFTDDSAWINVGDNPELNAKDSSGNVQDNPLNRRVPMRVYMYLYNGYSMDYQLVYEDTEIPEVYVYHKKSHDSDCGGCGTGSGLAFIPAVWIQARRRLRRRKKGEIRQG